MASPHPHLSVATQWKPGQSGNPSGRPRDVHRIVELARTHTVEAIETLVAIMRAGRPDAVRVAAAEALLARGWGKPFQPVDLDGELDHRFEIVVRYAESEGPGHEIRPGDWLKSSARLRGRGRHWRLPGILRGHPNTAVSARPRRWVDG